MGLTLSAALLIHVAAMARVCDARKIGALRRGEVRFSPFLPHSNIFDFAHKYEKYCFFFICV